MKQQDSFGNETGKIALGMKQQDSFGNETGKIALGMKQARCLFYGGFDFSKIIIQVVQYEAQYPLLNAQCCYDVL